jgi:hypothetical protein
MAWTATDHDHLVLFTVYDHPSDYPDSFVVRRHIVQKDGDTIKDEIRLADTLMGARDLLPPGVYNLGRYPQDDPVIIETWV